MTINHLSSSQITLYLLCGLKYRYQYIENIPRTFRSSALVFGGTLHSSLAWLHHERQIGNQVSLEKLFRVFDTDWFSQRVERDIRFKDGEDEMKLSGMGKEMLRQYFSQPYKKIKGSEVPFTVPLIHPTTKAELGLNFEGFFDLVEADETIVEFKSSAQALSASDIRSHLQVTAYGYAFGILFGRPPHGFKIVNFVKNKKPRLEVTETERVRADYEAFFYVAESVFRAIQKEIFIPRTGYWCRDCEYQALCPMWKGNGVNREHA